MISCYASSQIAESIGYIYNQFRFWGERPCIYSASPATRPGVEAGGIISAPRPRQSRARSPQRNDQATPRHPLTPLSIRSQGGARILSNRRHPVVLLGSNHV